MALATAGAALLSVSAEATTSVSAISDAAQVACYDIVPLPREVVPASGTPFVMDAGTVVVPASGLEREAGFLVSYVRELTGLEMSVSERAGRKASAIRLSLDESLPSEGYCIEVAENGITLRGGTAAGVFYGVQTLRKSLPAGAAQSVSFPAVKISDAPRFAYRGMMLDCARHFFSVDFVKEFIDILALHDMNTFHWHLTDDQGWRIEIKALPQLTEVGAWRSGTVIGNNSDVDDEVRYGGFYTQEEIRDVIAYAAERHVGIIPEIDLPGHMSAALATFPELGCTGGPYKVGHKWGVYNDVLCVGNPATLEFVKTVLGEVADLFPSDVIHVGGDETPTVRWEACPKCQAVQTGGKTLQGWFTAQVVEFLASKGKKAICWDEMLGMGADPSVGIMSWRGSTPGLMAAQQGHDVVMSPVTNCYFDYAQTKESAYEPSVMGSWPISVEKVYELEPAPDSLSAEALAHIKGVQANLWTEHVTCVQAAEYMLLPRAAALAEVQWAEPGSKDFDSFRSRIASVVKEYDRLGWKYALHLWPERMTQNRWQVDAE